MQKFFNRFQNKWFLIFGSIFLLFLIVVLARQYKQRYSIEKEISDLLAQQQDLQKNNQDLQDFIAYLNTDSYKETAAREQLNLQKPGEVVYSFAGAQQGGSSVTSSAAAPGSSTAPGTNPFLAAAESSAASQPGNGSGSQTQSNFSKWWDYIFKAGK